MARLTIYKDQYVDSTVVSNCFIDEYMADANDAQLKVYLYLIRMLDANQATSVSDMADKFNHTEKDVMRALKYWEQKQLLTLDYDVNRSLVGIHLKDLTRYDREEFTGSDTPVSLHNMDSGIPISGTQTFLSIPAAFSVPGAAAASFTPQASSLGAQASSFGTQAPSLGTQASSFGTQAPSLGKQTSSFAAQAPKMQEPAFARPSYTPDQLREFKEREETAQLLFIAESYIGRPLTPAEMKSILFFTDGLSFSFDLVDYLLQYCVDRGKKDFKYIEKVAVSWAEQGITTPKQAQKNIGKYDKNVYAIMNQLGKSGSPTSKEMEFINRWTKEYGFSTDIIFEACERTVLATDKHRFEYAEGILSSWKRDNVRRKADILRVDEMYQLKRRNTQKAPANKFNQFTQNEYDFDELEKELLSN